MKRVLCVWFPHWPLQRVCLVQPELKGRPVVLYGPAQSGSNRSGSPRAGLAKAPASAQRGDWLVVHCARAAVAAGVRPGMPLAEAQALLERPIPHAPQRAPASPHRHPPSSIYHDGTGGDQFSSNRCPPRRSPSSILDPPSSNLPSPHLVQHNPPADRKLLQALANWCSRYSPLVGMEQADEPSALFFDITGCAHLFGDEEHMAALVLHDFERVGYVVRVAVADTPGAAWAAVRFGRLLSPASPAAPIVVPVGGQQALLGPLPVAALRLPAKTIDTLHELGIRQIAQLQALPRSALPARFGAGVLERLDQAWGLVEELIVPVPPVEPIEAAWSFEEPTADRRALESVLQRLIGEIAETLAARQEGAQRLICRMFCVGKEPVQLTVGALQPTASAEHLAELIHLQLERVTLAREVLAIELEVVASGPLEWRQQEFFDAGVNREGERQLAVLLDRLSSRLGEKSVLRPRLCADPQPEYAGRLEAVLAETNPKSEIQNRVCLGKQIRGRAPIRRELVPPARLTRSSILDPPSSIHATPGSPASDSVPDYQLITGPAVRPLCLKPRPAPIEVVSIVPDGPPVRFRWQRTEHVVAQSWGPERIDTGWWRGPHVERDYYRVETTTGQRFWLFRQNDTGKNNTGKWFLHGTFE